MKRAPWIFVALAAGWGGPAAAQACTATLVAGGGNCTTAAISATLTIGRVVQLTLSSTTTALATPAAADFDAGFVASTGPTATVYCNTACRLQISASTATWTATTTVPSVPARANKPASDLQWSTASNGTFAGLTTTPTNVSSLGATAGTAVGIFYHTLYAWGLDTPGNYSLKVVFTLASP
ncbi:MAG TPA: hypothetical protein VMC86_11945 [Gemmatimonadales bacterium]|nr:hypothetical protein [Gemmatimonadales bacterium]